MSGTAFTVMTFGLWVTFDVECVLAVIGLSLVLYIGRYQRVQERRSLSARSWSRSQNSERSMIGDHFHFEDCKKISVHYFHERSLWVRSFLPQKSMWLFFFLLWLFRWSMQIKQNCRRCARYSIPICQHYARKPHKGIDLPKRFTNLLLGSMSLILNYCKVASRSD